jgi:hypothetical protein
MPVTIARRAGMAMVLAGMALPAAAMVSPVFQRLAELQAVIGLPGLATALGIPVDRIELIAPSLYRVTAGRCHVDVRLVEAQGPYPGRGLTPPRLEAQAGPRLCER